MKMVNRQALKIVKTSMVVILCTVYTYKKNVFRSQLPSIQAQQIHVQNNLEFINFLG